jgi:hypothetical protein
LRSLIIILGVLLVTYCGADVLLHTRYAGDLRMEERFCRFRLCDSAQWLRTASRALWQANPPAPEEAVADFLVVLKRDPHFPFSWVNLGDALAAGFESAPQRPPPACRPRFLSSGGQSDDKGGICRRVCAARAP